MPERKLKKTKRILAKRKYDMRSVMEWELIDDSSVVSEHEGGDTTHTTGTWFKGVERKVNAAKMRKKRKEKTLFWGTLKMRRTIDKLEFAIEKITSALK